MLSTNLEKADCATCHKIIDMDEYVVNWGFCSNCLDRSYSNYLIRKRIEKGSKVCLGTMVLFLFGFSILQLRKVK